AQSLHDAHRQSDLLERIALVEVETALHGHDAFAAQQAADEPAGVRLHRGRRKMRDLAKGNARLGLDLLGEPAPPGPTDDADARPAGPAGLNGSLGFLNLIVQLGHGDAPSSLVSSNIQ